MALNSFLCAHVGLTNYSLTHSLTHSGCDHIGHTKTISATTINHIGHMENPYRPHHIIADDIRHKTLW